MPFPYVFITEQQELPLMQLFNATQTIVSMNSVKQYSHNYNPTVHCS